MRKLAGYFHVDALALTMMVLVGFVGLFVALFSRRYLKGDRKYSEFFATLFCLIAAVFLMVTADHILLFLLAWAVSNLLLTRLMIHKPDWRAARFSGLLAVKNFAAGCISIIIALAILYVATGETSIQKLIHLKYQNPTLIVALLFLFIGAMTQSALWPFHRWLTSSLNSPTPVSAIMHAGLVNGGGFLLARFAPLCFQIPNMLTLLFIIGLISAILGTIWKLMQSDVKRMLASSTMSQMGFMILQCGLGLFPAAIAHLCWHGLFKSYLFLSSGSAAQEKRLDLNYPPAISAFFLSLLCGSVGAGTFVLSSHKNLFAGDTTLFIIGISFIAATQLALSILDKISWKNLLVAVCTTAVSGWLYGLSVYSIEHILSPLNIMQPQPLGIVHILAFSILAGLWAAVLFNRQYNGSQYLPGWMLRLYVMMLNASQPHPKTITAHRNHYQF